MKQAELDFKSQIVNSEALLRKSEICKQRQECANAYRARYVGLLQAHTENIKNLKRRIAQLKEDRSKMEKDTPDFLTITANIDTLSAELSCAQDDWRCTSAELTFEKAAKIEEYDEKSREICRWQAKRLMELKEDFLKNKDE